MLAADPSRKSAPATTSTRQWLPRKRIPFSLLVHPTPGALIQRGPRARGTDNRATIVLKPFPARNPPSRDASRRRPGGVYLWRSPAVSSLDVGTGMEESARLREPEAEAAIC